MPAVFVEVAESKATNGATSLIKDSVIVQELVLVVARWVKNVGGVVAVTCHEDVGTLVLVVAIGIDGVGEARGHVGNSE